jgi:hypothetical protein
VTEQPQYAIIHVKPTPESDAWPVVERVPGGWQSGVFHYPDEIVLKVDPLSLVPTAVLAVVLEEAGDALRDVGKKALVVKTTLEKPYPDAPDKNPWDQYMKAAASRAYNLGCQIRDTLRSEGWASRG